MLTVQNLLDRKKIRGVVSIPASSTVLDALRAFEENNIGAVLIMDSNKFVGIYTEQDYARKGELAGRSAMAPVKAVMTATEIKKVTPFANMIDCVEAMHNEEISHLVVVRGQKKKIVGIISNKDLVAALAEDLGCFRRELSAHSVQS